MPVLLQSEDILYLGISKKLICLNVLDWKSTIHDLPPINLPENLSNTQKELFEEVPIITTISKSANGIILAVSTHNRQVVIYNRKHMNVITNFIINRAASKVCFDKNNHLIVADKTGDAYLYKENQEPILLLGHLSMLLDVQISPCGNFIITSDRDEKIRVSHYPNCYNILCYCLGHEEFVTNIAIVNDQLLSASGDGTIRLWNYTSGSESVQVNTNQQLKGIPQVEVFKNAMDKNNIDVNAIPITEMQVCEYQPGFALIAITLLDWNNLEIYTFDYKLQSISHSHSINNRSTIVAFSLNTHLCILTTRELVAYTYVNNKFVQCLIADNIFNIYNDLFTKYLTENDVFLLYKKKYDNVQDYLDRKKQRLGEK